MSAEVSTTPVTDTSSNSLLGGLPEQSADKVGAPSDGSSQAASKGPEVKAEGSKDAPNDKPKDAATTQKVEGAPEKYADFKLPEGMKLDPVATEKFTQLAKALNLPQENAQKLVDLQTEFNTLAEKQRVSEFNKVVEGWKSETLKSFGATDYQEALRPAAVLLNKFASPELRQFLNDSKFGDHPELAKFLVTVGKHFEQDTKTFDGKSGIGNSDSLAKTLYPNHN